MTGELVGIPRSVLAMPTPTPQESVMGLVRRAARALGIASESCLRDYFRTRAAMTRHAITTLVESGELIPVDPGVREPALVPVARGTSASSKSAPAPC